MSTSVVIPTHNRPEGLEGLLRDLAKQRDVEPLEVVVVNSEVGDDMADVVARVRADTGLKVRQIMAENTIALKRNAGAAATSGEVICFFDDDMRLDDDVVAAHLAAQAARPDSLISGAVEFLPEWVTNSNYYRYKNTRHMNQFTRSGDLTPVNPNNIVTMNLSIRRAVFEDIGGFDAAFRHYGGEDVEFGFRAAAQGYPLLYSRQARAWHVEHRLDILGYTKKLYENAYYGTPKVLAAWPEGRLVVPTWRWTEPGPNNPPMDKAFNLALRVISRPRLVAAFANLLTHLDKHRWAYWPLAYKALTLLVQQVAVGDRRYHRQARPSFARS